MTEQAEPEIVTVESVTTAVVHGTVPMTELTDFYDSSFHTLGRVLGEQGVTMVGPPFGLYLAEPTDTVELEVGFRTDRLIETDGEAHASMLPEGRVARVVHTGSYETLGESWGRLASWILQQGASPGGPMWEVYLTEPTPDADPTAMQTELNWRLAD
jgi:effector-binding domain-containing protein